MTPKVLGRARARARPNLPTGGDNLKDCSSHYLCYLAGAWRPYEQHRRCHDQLVAHAGSAAPVRDWRGLALPNLRYSWRAAALGS